MTSIKICGLKDTETLSSILHLPIDHIGFVFAKSKRQVTPQQAGELIRVIADWKAAGNAAPLTVGVLVNPSREELTVILNEAPLDILQLHGHETPEECQWIKNEFPGVQLWRVVSVTQTRQEESNYEAHRLTDAIALQLDPYKDVVDAILLDTFDPVYGGGSGKTFSWETIPPYQAWSRATGIPLLIAGGFKRIMLESC